MSKRAKPTKPTKRAARPTHRTPPPPLVAGLPLFIVAECSKNWHDGVEVAPALALLSQQFEDIINTNWERGYRLLQFQVHRVLTGRATLNETIIAVFERRGL